MKMSYLKKNKLGYAGDIYPELAADSAHDQLLGIQHALQSVSHGCNMFSAVNGGMVQDIQNTAKECAAASGRLN
ncbi:hypothetical protein [Siminovitchia sp. 179-K 8D1 HS]|uniref:hypothetical protein n=1 Tax=Siminovitchia sp. 179-K 8D1 HS TaxID=3142385 RepID=UPI0039A2C40A